tara:strand:- start:266 stop:1555 length:1290 start_codon:yes stop_codon:yes gene_type:complete
MADMPSPEELKERRENAARKAFMLNRPMSIADFAPEKEPPGAFATGSPSSPEGQKVFRATEKASLTPPNAPSATALMAEEALGIPLGIPIEKAAVKVAKPVIEAAKPVVDAAKPYFDSVVEGLTSMVKKTPKVADEVPKKAQMAKAADEPFVALKEADDGSDPPILEFEIEKSYTIGPALQAIVKHAANPAAARIAARIEPFVRDVPVTIARTVDEVFDEGLERAYGTYSASEHRIRLRGRRTSPDYQDLERELAEGNLTREERLDLITKLQNYTHLGHTGAEFADTVLHEAIHAATTRRFEDGLLSKNSGTKLHKAAHELADLFDEVLNQFHLENEIVKEQYRHALFDEDEFIAYGLSNREFQEYLMTIKVPGSNQSLWSKFVTLVADLLGIAPGDQTALGELLRTTDELLAAPLSELRDSVYDTRPK